MRCGCFAREGDHNVDGHPFKIEKALSD